MADRPDAVTVSRLPNAAAAVVPAEKLIGYLLSPTHPVGRAKAAYFRRLGYDGANAADLAARLVELAVTGAVVEVEPTGFGDKYAVEGWLPAADGGPPALVRTVWMVRAGETLPRLVTAYPA